MTGKRRIEPYHAVAAVLSLLALLAMVKTLFSGLEIEEQYALSIGWRLVKGDALFYTMWEPHQMSALPAAFLLWLFYTVTGTTTGVLLFVRAVTLLLKAGLSVWFYRTMRPQLSGQTAFLTALALFVYTPEWFLSPGFLSQQFHFTVAAFLCFYGYLEQGRGLWRMALGGVFLSLSVLALPQSAAAVPFWFAGLFLLGRRRGQRRLAGIPAGMLTALAACAVCAAAFAAWLLRGVSLPMLLDRAELIFRGAGLSAAESTTSLPERAAAAAALLARPALAALAVALLGIARDIRRRKDHPIRNIRYWIGFFFALFGVLALILCLLRAVRYASPDEYGFAPALALAGLWCFRRSKDTPRSLLLWLGYLPGVAAGLCLLCTAPAQLTAAFPCLIWPGLCTVLALAMQTRAAVEARDVPDPTAPYALDGDWADGLILIFLVFLIFCRSFLMPATGGTTLLDTPMEYLSDGPAAFTWADQPSADMYHALELALEPCAGQQILLSTGEVEGLAFLMDGGSLRVGQASVVPAADSDTRFASYYLELPDKAPDVIVYDNNSTRDLSDLHAWLEQQFDIESRTTVTYGSASLEVLTVSLS